MAGQSPSPLGAGGNQPQLDTQTLNLQRTATPGATGAGALVRLGSDILVGTTERDPEKNADGTAAEDALYGDMPPQSASIRTDAMFKKSDADLKAALMNLITTFSMGDLDTAGREMVDQFCAGTGGSYRHDAIDSAIYDNDVFGEFHRAFTKRLLPMMKDVGFVPASMQVLTVSPPNFSSLLDKATGLGILVHQVWAVKIHVNDLAIDPAGPWWQFNLDYTFYDEFGLDWPDVDKIDKDTWSVTHQYLDEFKAWYILQHYRSARPLLTTMKRRVFMAGQLGK